LVLGIILHQPSEFCLLNSVFSQNEVIDMFKALNSAASSLNTLIIKMDVIAGNVANVNTPAYKKDTVIFAELASQDVGNSGIPVSNDAQETDFKVGGGIRIAAVVKNFKAGDIINTSRPLDLAVDGEGFFKVISPEGEERYTREGYFTLNQGGGLVTPSGYALEGVQLSADSGNIVITQNGTVLTGEAGNSTEAGQIQLYKFTSMTGLKAEGENLYSLISGETQAGVPGDEGFGTVRQGCLETSNVDLLEETANLIEMQRAYGFSSNIIKTVDEMWGLANNMRK
jgi:flagellar basal-body rod protein FlgG